MSFIELASKQSHAKIKVIGVGGAGGNAINTMIEHGLEGVEFIVANTDLQALERSNAPYRIQLGAKLTNGLGAGGDPEIGRKSALEDVSRLREEIGQADMVFITAGMGGGTGTGAAPIIADALRGEGILTVGVVTKPFHFEGKRRMEIALRGIQEFTEVVDTLITIPNDKLLEVAEKDLPLIEAFKLVDLVLVNAVRGISDIIVVDGLINVDFADVKAIMKGRGNALMGTGYGRGEKRALEAAEEAISSPLLDDVSIEGATGVLINVTGGTSLTLHEVDEAATYIKEASHEEANIIWGAVIEPEFDDQAKITVIATGFKSLNKEAERLNLQTSKENHEVNQKIHSPQYETVERTSQQYSKKGTPQQIELNMSYFKDIPSWSPEKRLDYPTFLRRKSREEE
jgi:cell division protein FtsZ